jgi:hypothetical protein
MVEFGSQASRKQLWDQYDNEFGSITNLGKDKAELIF